MAKSFVRNMGTKVKIIREDGSTALINPKIVDHEAVKQLNIRLAPEVVPVTTKRFTAVPPVDLPPVDLPPAEGDEEEETDEEGEEPATGAPKKRKYTKKK